MADFLRDMAESSRQRAEAARREVSESDLRARIDRLPPPLQPAGDFLLIAEVKRISPAAGLLQSGHVNAGERARQYVSGGAGVISVLAEPSRFGGSMDDLAAAAGAVNVPVMRKDFLVDPWQVLEARAWNASGVLLIVKMLDDVVLCEMMSLAHSLGMFTLIEAFDAEDLRRAGSLLDTGSCAQHTVTLVGINTRDLRTLEVDPVRLEELVGLMPAGLPRIAESGMETPAEVQRAAEMGYDGVLVGSALMRADDPVTLCTEMARAGLRGRSRHALQFRRGK